MVEPSWVGRRIAVRRSLGTGAQGRPAFSDVVGELIELDAERAVLDTRRGRVELRLTEIVVGRVAHPSTGDELALEAVAARGWRPAETGAIGGWVLRASGGFTGRGNSVLPLRAPGRPLEEALAAARAWYADRHLPLRFQIPVEARRLLDATLAEQGWTASPDVHVMAARLDLLAGTAGGDPEVVVASAPDEDWFALYRDGEGTVPEARALLTRHDNAGFATIRDDGRLVAIGRGAIDEGWLGVTAVEVEPHARRQGLAGAVMRALRDWGLARGASRTYLQVTADNLPAVRFYEGIGYWHHHDYRYRDDPQAR